MTPKNEAGKKQDTGGKGLSLIRSITGPWTWENLWGWLKIILIVLVIRWIWFEPYSIPSGSMEPTLHGDPRFLRGDRVVVNKFWFGPRIPFTNKRLFRWHEPERWDIVVFNSPEPDAQHKVLIKRVVGLPGERVHIEGGRVYVNGKPLELPEDIQHVSYTSAPSMRSFERLSGGELRLLMLQHEMRYGILPDERYSVVPENHYLVLGDNSADSKDGRYFGWVPHENLIGRAFAIWWPLSHRRDLTGFTNTWWGMALLLGLPALLLLYEGSRAFFWASWRVCSNDLPGELREGEHILVSRIALGLRLPFSRRRIIPGRGLRRGETVVHVSEQDGSGRSLKLSRVIAVPGETVNARLDMPCVERKKNSQIVRDGYYLVTDGNPAAGTGCVSSLDLVGVAQLVWWPLHRRRKLAAPGAANSTRTA